jgi:uncharacterized protein (TIGR00661 family)
MPKVLIAPLDWGLGHTTRCIPLINSLQKQGWAITLAAEGNAAKLLESTFPDISILDLKGYRIRYAKNQIGWKIVQQIPSISASIQYEKNWLKEKYADHRWEVIISDNRLGFYHPKAYNIYITHQLYVQTGLGRVFNTVASKLHQSFIKKFNELWIPDVEGGANLSGSLSHPNLPGIAAQYIGPISRLHPSSSVSCHYDILFLLSGPEPQRSILENIILGKIQPHHRKLLLIRGTKDRYIDLNVPDNVTVIDLANSDELNQYMLQSKYVICRSGYTTLMDLMRLQKKAMLVPTPGQGEQEYLATYATEQNYFPSARQNEFNIDKAIEEIEKFNFSFPFNELDFHQYEKVIQNLNF